MEILFTKMQGLGNDFIMINNLNGVISFKPEQVRYMCDRHFGIGADGLILLEDRSSESDCYMNYYNSDGSIVEMCGNGIRCTARFYLEIAKPDKSEININTPCGVKSVSARDGVYSVNMGRPMFDSGDFPREPMEVEDLKLHFVSMGNPHAVAFVKNINDFDLENIGPKIENHKLFPNKINFEIVEKLSDNKLKMRVWERGSGITLACGTGACAVYAVSKKDGIISSESCKIELPGGLLQISENNDKELIMSGGANVVYKGSIEI